MTKEIVEIRFKNPKKTGSVSMNPYYREDGTFMQLVSEANEPRTIRMTKSIKLLDLSNPKEQEEYEFIKTHPFVVGREKLIVVANITEKSEEAVTKKDMEFEALKIVKELQGTKLADFARILGVHAENINESVIKAKVYEIADTDPKRIITEWSDDDRGLKALLQKGRQRGVFKVNTKSGVWKYRQVTMGTNEEQSLQWLKDSKDLMPSIRKQVNTL